MWLFAVVLDSTVLHHNVTDFLLGGSRWNI